MTNSPLTQQALNKAMMEAVDFIHAEGWDAAPTLFALVPSSLLIDALQSTDGDDDTAPLTLVVQDSLPANLGGGSEELEDYISRLAWPVDVAGVILAQEIMFRDSPSPSNEPRPARLFSGVLRGGEELTLLQIRPTEDELAAQGPFAEVNIELRGGPQVAPGVIAALRYTLEQEAE